MSIHLFLNIVFLLLCDTPLCLRFVHIYTTFFLCIESLCATSPEVAELGHDVFTPASDIWALGCVFYELLSLRHPFGVQSLNLIELVRSVRFHDTPELPEIYSDGLKALIGYIVKYNLLWGYWGKLYALIPERNFVLPGLSNSFSLHSFGVFFYQFDAHQGSIQEVFS